MIYHTTMMCYASHMELLICIYSYSESCCSRGTVSDKNIITNEDELLTARMMHVTRDMPAKLMYERGCTSHQNRAQYVGKPAEIGDHRIDCSGRTTAVIKQCQSFAH